MLSSSETAHSRPFQKKRANLGCAACSPYCPAQLGFRFSSRPTMALRTFVSPVCTVWWEGAVPEEGLSSLKP